jgi:hypothetical protein
LSEKELRVLERYYDGAEVTNKDDRWVLEKFRKIGYVRYGAHCDNSDKTIKPTAKLTSLGQAMVRKEVFLKRGFFRLLFS